MYVCIYIGDELPLGDERGDALVVPAKGGAAKGGVVSG